MRSSSDALTGTRRFSSRAMCSIESRWSCTLHLTQQLTEPLTGTHDAHLERRHPDPRELRHFVVTHVVNVLQQESFPLFWPNLLKRSIDLFAPRISVGRVFFRRLENRCLVDDERLRAPTAPRSQRTTAIHQNSEQPRAEALRILTSPE